MPGEKSLSAGHTVKVQAAPRRRPGRTEAAAQERSPPRQSVHGILCPRPAAGECGTGRFQPHRMERRQGLPGRTTRPGPKPGGAMEYLKYVYAFFSPQWGRPDPGRGPNHDYCLHRHGGAGFEPHHQRRGRKAAVHPGHSAGGKALRYAPGRAGGKQERRLPAGCGGAESDAAEKQAGKGAGGVSAPGAPLPLPRAVPAACMRTLSANRAPRLRAGGMPAAGLAGERGKMCPPSGRAAGRAAMESGLPPVLAAAGPAWRVHPLECV